MRILLSTLLTVFSLHSVSFASNLDVSCTGGRHQFEIKNQAATYFDGNESLSFLCHYINKTIESESKRKKLFQDDMPKPAPGKILWTCKQGAYQARIEFSPQHKKSAYVSYHSTVDGKPQVTTYILKCD